MISNNNPLTTPIKYTKERILKFSFKSLLVLNNTKIATPLPVSSPAIIDEKEIISFKYNSVNTIDAPQFGIRPIRLAKNGERK